MKNINWKLRLKNKATLLALLVTSVAFVYHILGMLDVVPSVSEDDVISIIRMVVDLLAMLGIIVDPTTSGITDSQQAMEYSCPHTDE